ncbi:MAG TPA: sulfotransferase [Steroidobacteraceae bacterium]
MSASTDLDLMRASMMLDKDPAAAARIASALLQEEPGQDAATLLLTAACRRLGNSADALDAMETLALAQPASAVIQLELGRTYAACGRYAAAQAALERALDLDAGLADAWREISELCLLENDTARADAAYLKYRRLATDPPELAEAYGAFDQNRLETAESLAQQRSREGSQTQRVAGFTLLAAVAQRRGDDLAEGAALNELLRLAPCDASAREQLVRLMIRQGRVDEALPLIDRLLTVEPNRRDLLILKAEALQLIERPESLGIITALLAEHADDADLWLIAGNQQRFSGHTGEAIESYRRAIELAPGKGLAYWALANLQPLGDSPEMLALMQRQLAAASPDGYDGTCLEFALGKVLEDRGEFAAAFEHYARGNRRARSSFNYDARATTAFVQRFKATFTPRFFAERMEWGCEDPDPIFIVGLPRSGSTLLEQILASHSQVEATRELPYVPTLARELAGAPATAAHYPEGLARLSNAEVGTLAARYLASARRHRLLGRPRFVDKMHANFMSLALIHLMFPRATIIDSRRHPLGCGFACYKQLFSAGLNFAYDLTEVGLYYRDYADLMDHIDAVLPGRVHRVHYERLVAEPEAEVRRLLENCSLPYEQACLSFHENPRTAQSLSSEQVRRPIYSEGAQHWRHFEPWLEPLKSAVAKKNGGH